MVLEHLTLSGIYSCELVRIIPAQAVSMSSTEQKGLWCSEALGINARCCSIVLFLVRSHVILGLGGFAREEWYTYSGGGDPTGAFPTIDMRLKEER
jgi:hypothetical protein